MVNNTNTEYTKALINMLTDFPPRSVNKSGNIDDIPIPQQLKVRSDDRVLNTVLQFSKTNMLDSDVQFIEKLKQALIPHYSVSNITDYHLLKIVFDKYNKIFLDKRFEVCLSIDSIVLDLLKFTSEYNIEAGIKHSNGTIFTPYITYEMIIKQLLTEICLSRVDWLDYSQI